LGSQPGRALILFLLLPHALRHRRRCRTGLVFPDSQLPGLTGLQFLNICGLRVKVIFTTAYPAPAL
jgi:hypothetical protein